MAMKPLQTLVDEEYAKSSAADVAAAVAPLNAQITKLKADLAACQAGGGGGGDTTKPSTPTGGTATVVSASQITYNWTASTDNVAVVGYDVFRNGAPIGTRVGTSYADTGLTAATTYSYSVQAKDAAGNVSAMSATVSATTQGTVTPPPTGGYPKTSDTGNKPGVARTAYTGPVEITTANTIIKDKNISGTMTVKASGVQFQNCAFTNFSWYAILSENQVVTVEDCAFDGRGSVDTYCMGIKGGTVRRCDIRGMVIGIGIWSDAGTIIEDNYIHDLATASSDPAKRHFDGVVCRGGGNISIKHNTIEVSDGTASVFLTGQEGQVHDVRVENNLLLGQASYTCYAEASTGGIVRSGYYNNLIERGIYGYILNDSGSADVGNTKWQEGKDPSPAAYIAWKAKV